MRVGIDILQATPRIGGGWHYAENLLQALAEADGDDEYYVFVNSISAEIVPTTRHFRIVKLPLRPASRVIKAMYESLIPGLLAPLWRLDCMYHLFGTLPFGSRRPNVVTIYDLMVFERPHDFSPIRRAYVRTMRRRVARSATMIAPMSEYTATQLNGLLGVTADRLQVVPAAIGTNFHRRSEAERSSFRKRYALPKDFWLYVAGELPHKNHARLVEAYGQLRQRLPEAWPLVVRGPTASGLDSLLGGSSWRSLVHLLPRIPDEEMPVLYSTASALVFPSLFEGGGLPVMEAMSCGCPVAASDIPTTYEFAGPAAVTFDPSNVESIIGAMRTLQQDADLRNELRALGLQRSVRFDPRFSANAMKAACRRAVAAARGR
jgi:glycosyltransferase involved in cell wall biosynthesis